MVVLDVDVPDILRLGERNVRRPAFFASISSVKANLPLQEYLSVIRSVGYPHVLVSAYDLDECGERERDSVWAVLTELAHDGCEVLLDSGNYERYWRRDEEWSQESFDRILRRTPCQLALSFDCFDGPAACGAAADIVTSVVAGVNRTHSHGASSSIIPIVHGTTDVLPEAVIGVASSLRPVAVAVAERRLGAGIRERATMVRRLRDGLNGMGWFCPLHLLGTGNPLSVLIYSMCGADTFDGLEWCQTCVDHESGLLYHSQQWDFFRDQTPVGRCGGAPFLQSVAVHNLVFYAQWTSKIATALGAGTCLDLLRCSFPGSLCRRVCAVFPDLFGAGAEDRTRPEGWRA